jgi:hypothetical protein
MALTPEEENERLQSQIERLTTRVNQLTASAGQMTDSANKSTGVIDRVTGTFITMARAGIDGGAGLRNMSSVLGTLWPEMGKLKDVLDLSIDVLEKNIATQVDLSRSGVTFGGNLDEMRGAANRSYLELSQFAGVVRNNADILVSFGGNVEGGTKRLVEIQEKLLSPGTATANMLATLGVQADEAATFTASWMRMQGGMNRTQLQDTQQISNAVAQYAIELTGISNLTGISRKQLQDKMNVEAQDIAFRMMLSGKSEEEKAKIEQDLAFAASQGQGYLDAYKAKMLDLPPVSEAGKIFTATMSESSAQMDRMIAITRDRTISAQDAMVAKGKDFAESMGRIRDEVETYRTIIGVSSLTGSNFNKAIGNVITTSLNMEGMAGKSKAEIDKYIEGIFKPDPTVKTQAAQGTEDIRKVQKAINDNLISINELLTSFRTNVTSVFTGTLNTVINPMTKNLSDQLRGLDFTEVKTQIKTTFEKYGGEIVQEINKLIKNVVGPGVQAANLANQIIPAIQGDKAAQEKLSNDLIGIWTKATDAIRDYFVSNKYKPSEPNTATPGQPGSPNTSSFLETLRDAIIRQQYAPSTPATGPIEGPRPRATGGETTPGSYLVGEEGPEILNLGTRGDVISNDNLTAMISALANQNGMEESIDQLNNTNGQMLSAIKELIEVSKRTLTATKGLNGNLFAA